MRILAGPPGAGKTTFAYNNIGGGDIVIDYDSLAVALTWQQPHDYSRTRRDLVRNMCDWLLNRAVEDNIDGWYLTSDPRPTRLAILGDMVGQPVHVMRPARHELMRRVADRPPHPGGRTWEEIVDRWANLFEWHTSFVRVG